MYPRGFRRRRTVVVAATCAVFLAACGSGAAADHRDTLLRLPVPATVTVTAHSIAPYGDVLTDSGGRALYMFPPDTGGRVTCTGACAGTWPPLVVADGARPGAGHGVISADLGTLRDPNTGARVVTYAGYPLYRYAGDLRAGTANGQGLFLNGGPWYVLRPSGDPVTGPGAPS